MEMKMCVVLEVRVLRKPHMCSSLRLRVLGEGMRRQSPDALWVYCPSSGRSALTCLRAM